MENNKKTAKVIGKVAKLPKGYNAVKFMENIKIPYKNKLWYILVEKQEDELHCIKYNQDGVNVNQFVADLKGYYINKFKGDANIKQAFEKIQVVGNDKFSVIKNVQNIDIEGKKLISKLTEDLIKLLK
jgi:hypothetical protein